MQQAPERSDFESGESANVNRRRSFARVRRGRTVTRVTAPGRDGSSAVLTDSRVDSYALAVRTDASKWRTPFAGVALGIVLVAQILASSATSEAAPRAAPSATVWLCRPGLAADPCDVDEATSAVSASGAVSAVSRTPGRAGFDCFYVYPTVSTELSANADLTVGLTEIDTAKIQASQFSSVCNVYAPMYRQRTLASLATGLGTDPAANAVAYSSLESGWTDFLKDYSNGRPFVLIGHSQGAAMLILLIRNEIDKDPSLRSRLVSAIILGGNVQVPDGKGRVRRIIPECPCVHLDIPRPDA